MCCNSPQARARREARRAAKIAFAAKLINTLRGDKSQKSIEAGPEQQRSIGFAHGQVQHGTTGQYTQSSRPQMYARSAMSTQLPSYEQVMDGKEVKVQEKQAW